MRRILGVLALAKHHGVGAVEAACATALELDVPSYRFVRRYLERRLPSPLTLRQIEPLIRQLTLYRDLIDRRAEKEVPEMTLAELDRALRQLRLSGSRWPALRACARDILVSRRRRLRRTVW